MRIRSRRASLLVALLLAPTAFIFSGCAGLFDSYPNAEKPADMVGTWTHEAGRLTLNEDGTFAMTDMPKWVTLGDSSATGSGTVSCTGTWSLNVEVQNFYLSSMEADCGGHGFATGRQDEMTIAFGIDGGSGDPRCYELVRDGSTLTPRGFDDCIQYN
jgi:hypothetical protein